MRHLFLTARITSASIACAAGLAIALAAPAPLSAAAGRSLDGSASLAALGQQANSPVPVLAFYYIWFNHSSWDRAKKNYPLIGTYSSSQPSVMRHQIEQAKSAGIDGFIVSWKNTLLNNQRLQMLMTVAAQMHFKLAMIYQGLNFYRRPLPVTEVARDFIKFRDKYASNPVFFRLGGKPLTIWSGTWAFSHAQIAQVTGAVRQDMTVLSTEKNLDGFLRVADVTDGDAYYWSSVNPATNTFYGAKLNQMSRAIHRDGKYWIAPFAPGFDARMVGGHEFVSRKNGQTLRTEYATALRSSPDAFGLISWNEWSENSFVEPSERYGYQSLDVLRQLRGTALPQPTGPAAPSETGAARPGGRTPAAWPNLLRLAGFPIVLAIAVGVIGYVRRRAARISTARPPGHRRPGHWTKFS
jgi:hypothetical protein